VTVRVQKSVDHRRPDPILCGRAQPTESRAMSSAADRDYLLGTHDPELERLGL
jgi:hypothetical protein